MDAFPHLPTEVDPNFVTAFQLAVEASRQLLGAQFAGVALPAENGCLRYVILSGFPDDADASTWRQPFAPNESVTGQAFTTGKTYFYRPDDAMPTLPWFTAAGGQSILAMPIHAEDRVVGALTIGWRAAVRRPSPAKMRLLRLITSQMGLSVETQMLLLRLADSERKALRLSRLNAILSRINLSIVGARSRQSLLTRMCETITADGQFVLAWIGFADPASGDVDITASSGEATAYLTTLKVSVDPASPYGQGPAGRALRGEGTQIIADILTDPSFAMWRQYAEPLGLRSCISSRFQDASGVAGALSVYSKEPNAFGQVEIQELMAELVSSISFALAHLALIDQEATAEQQVRHMAYHDPLTGLPNRLLLEDRLGQMLEAGRRYRRSFAVCVLDLDDFKSVNDSYGHHFGDRILRQLTQRLTGSLRAVDTMARFGGDEFVLLVDAVHDQEHLTQLLNRLIEMAKEPVKVDDVVFQLGVSIGAALFPEDGEEQERLVSRADQAMYLAKSSGGNCYRLAAKL